MASGYWAPLAIASADGPTLTAAAAATSLVPGLQMNINSVASGVQILFQSTATA